jgi:Flp pilus assembly protein TadD
MPISGPRRFTIAALIMLALLPGCATDLTNSRSSFGDRASGLQSNAELEFYPNDQLLATAKSQFSEGNYGNAEAYYRRAVEVFPNDPEAWLGLAASYDRLRRFDLADRAYQQAARYVGNTAEYHNNVGYSHLLRGNLRQARRNFLKAYELDPDNLTIINNLELLGDSISHPARAALESSPVGPGMRADAHPA